MRSKRSLIVALLLASALLLLASTQVWARFELAEGAAVVDEVELSGRQTLIGAMPIAIALIAISLVLAIAGRVARPLMALLAMLLGGWAVVASALFAVRPERGIVEAGAGPLTEVTGLSPGEHDAIVQAVHTTAWPWLAVVAGALAVAAAILVLVFGGRWRAAGRRYETGANAPRRRQAPEGDRIAEWDALSGGDDPTERDIR